MSAPLLVGRRLTLGDVVRVARDRQPVALCPSAAGRIAESRAYIEQDLPKLSAMPDPLKNALSCKLHLRLLQRKEND